MKKALLFDLDDTLLDFRASETYALEKIFQNVHIPYNKENIALYHRVNLSLWQAYEEGKIPREGITNARFPQFFEKMGNKEDGLLAEESFRNYLIEANKLVPEAKEILGDLSGNYALYVVTNGVAVTQKNRLKKSGLDVFFNEVFISEELGVQKPDPQFFNEVFATIPQEKEEALIIGDSLSSDIKGGFLSQIESVWYNPKEIKNTTDISPTFEIKCLKELPKILKNS